MKKRSKSKPRKLKVWVVVSKGGRWMCVRRLKMFAKAACGPDDIIRRGVLTVEG